MRISLWSILYNAIEERLRHQERSESPTTVFESLASGQINRLRVNTTGQTQLTLTELTFHAPIFSGIGLRIGRSEFHPPTHTERHAILVVVTNLVATIPETLAAQ